MTRITGASALALLAATAPALADVTAESVWADWKGVLERAGQSVAVGSEEKSGGTLTLNDVTTIIEFPEGAGTATSSLAEITFTELGDGTVSIALSPEIRTLLSLVDGGTRADMTVTTTHEGFGAIASGDADLTSYTFHAESFTSTVSDVKEDGATKDAAASFVMSGVTGFYEIALGGTVSLNQLLTVEGVTAKGHIKEEIVPGAPIELSFAGELDGFQVKTLIFAPDLPDGAPLDEVLDAGFKVSFDVGYGAGSGDFSGRADATSFTSRATTGGGTLAMSMDREAIDLALSGLGMDLSGTSTAPDGSGGFNGELSLAIGEHNFAFHADMPESFALEGAALFEAGLAVTSSTFLDASSFAFKGSDGITDFDTTASIAKAEGVMSMSSETLAFSQTLEGLSFQSALPEYAGIPSVGMSLGENVIRLSMPLVPSDTPRDFAATFTLRDLTLSDTIWDLFDPGAVLPRDPLTAVIDQTGKMRLLVDILNPEAGTDGVAEPMELNAVTISELELTGGGASLTGTGGFTFDYTDRTTYPGTPKPVGVWEFGLTGANALLDKLIQIGLIPEEQAMGTRMMIGMFARPGDTPDSLVSKIEFTEEGRVVANGMTIR